METSLPEDAESVLTHLLERHRHVTEGKLADYIPALADADPALFGIAAVGVDGRCVVVGDCDVGFTVQSISKPFTYGLALSLAGRDMVRKRIDVEPTGDAFNSLIELEDGNHRPFNPMINSGAIAATAIVHEHLGDATGERVHRFFEAFAGRELAFDAETCAGELEAGDRNRAIAYLLKHHGILKGEVDDILALYSRQCSVTVTVRDIAAMAATLANQGTQPLSGEQVIDPGFVHDLVTLMFTCGMYDSAGRWAFDVGVPAKSGVGGGLIAVVPGRMGIGVFSPKLDRSGHSVRAARVLKDLSRAWNLSVIRW